ncbi:hypothetical protein AwPolaro_06820 [Polaromonas sp.]|nr:hypothetical protein AwPolaro_06820 [Polaromonas sp.]
MGLIFSGCAYIKHTEMGVLQSFPSDRTYIKGTIMPIEVSNDTFRDADSGEVLIQSKNYFAKGGWLMRYTPLSMNSPDAMLFDGNGCGWIKEWKILSNNQIVQIN